MAANRYTHGHHDSVLRSHRWRSVDNSAAYLRPHLARGTLILDVGCGPGTLTADLAEHVPGGAVTGVDASADVIAAARSAAPDDLDADLDFRIGDVYTLDFDERRFDVVHAHQVLQHLSDPVRAFAEMGRVCRTGGVVAVRDVDYASMVWAPRSPPMTRWLDAYREVARANDAEPDAGRHLRRWAREAGFGQARATASSWCYADPEACRWWSDLWADRVTDSELAEQFEAVGVGVDERDEIAASWRRWGADEDAWFAMVHGELIIENGR